MYSLYLVKRHIDQVQRARDEDKASGSERSRKQSDAEERPKKVGNQRKN